MSSLSSTHAEGSVPARQLPWRVPLVAALAWASGVALLISLQFLTQDWVWENWPASDVFVAWLYLLRDRVAVAIAITLFIWGAGLLPVSSLRWRALLLACAIVVGAAVGEMSVRLIDDQHRDSVGVTGRWAIVALALAAMFYLWRSSIEARSRLQSQTLDRLRAQQEVSNAHLVALRNQIEPHFLFNTLATVRRLHQTEPEAGAALLANFIDYLRHAMPMLDRSQVPLKQELSLLRAYLAVIAVRMSGRLQVEIDVPPEFESLPIPPLILATLVENAVKHGLTPSPEGGLLRIVASRREHHIEIAVEDTGVGFGLSNAGGSGIGLANVRARLHTLHGGAATLRLEVNQPRGVRAIVSLPLAANGSDP